MSRKDPLPKKKQNSQAKALQPKLVNSQAPRIAQMKPGPTAPPVYRPQPTPRVLQTKKAPNVVRTNNPQIDQRRPVAPPVYRPQPVPRVLQPKMAHTQQSSPSIVIQRTGFNNLPPELVRMIRSHLPNPRDAANLRLADRRMSGLVNPLTVANIREWKQRGGLDELLERIEPPEVLGYLRQILGNAVDHIPELHNFRVIANPEPPPPPLEPPPAPAPAQERIKREREEDNNPAEEWWELAERLSKSAKEAPAEGGGGSTAAESDSET